jgi:hypothetical protein
VRHFSVKLGNAMTALALPATSAENNSILEKVPADVRATTHFQEWYLALVACGHELVDVPSVEWVFRVGAQNYPLFFALRVSIRVFGENRIKSNEVVIVRPSVTCVCVVARGATADEDRFVVSAEYRTTVMNARGRVIELPSGSSPFSRTTTTDVVEIGLKRLKQETGLELPRERFTVLGSRQCAATMIANRAHLIVAELSNAEMNVIAKGAGVAHGSGGPAQDVTYLYVMSRKEIADSVEVDWATQGMIAATLRE